MILIRSEEGCEPSYMTLHSSCADLKARKSVKIEANGRALVPTGLWIQSIDWKLVPANAIPELQIRARSGLSLRSGLMLANGVGTIDADFKDEIGVIFFNSTHAEIEVKKGDRIAQLALCLTYRIPNLAVGDHRTGGFGSTGNQ